MLDIPNVIRRKPSRNALRLVSQFFRFPQSVGTIVPSSRELAEIMIEPINFAVSSTIIEYGPGSGAITEVITERLSSHSRYIGIEINSKFCEALTVRFPHLKFVNENAGDIEHILRSFNIDRVDAIICGLPWASLPSAQQSLILNGVQRCLRPGGIFVTYAYIQGLVLPGAWALRRRLKNRFSSVVTTPIVWNNIPPAFAYICKL